MSPNSKLNDIVGNLPHKPGVYQFLNANEEIIYIGKAKDIQKRVSSYFVTETKSYKQETLTNKIESIKTEISHIIYLKIRNIYWFSIKRL